MVLDVDGEVTLTGLERDPVRHRPARERAVALEPEVVVEPARVVALNDEDRLARALSRALERLRRGLRIALAAVFGKLLGHRIARRFGPRPGGLHPRSERGSDRFFQELLHPAGGRSRPVFTGLEP